MRVLTILSNDPYVHGSHTEGQQLYFVNTPIIDGAETLDSVVSGYISSSPDFEEPYVIPVESAKCIFEGDAANHARWQIEILDENELTDKFKKIMKDFERQVGLYSSHFAYLNRLGE